MEMVYSNETLAIFEFLNFTEDSIAERMLFEKPVFSEFEFEFGPSLETLIVSVKIGEELLKHEDAIKMYNILWTQEDNGITPITAMVLTANSARPTSNGRSNGLEMTLDLETFNNADFMQPGDGLRVVLENNDNLPNFDINGFFVQPGQLATIKGSCFKK